MIDNIVTQTDYVMIILIFLLFIGLVEADTLVLKSGERCYCENIKEKITSSERLFHCDSRIIDAEDVLGKTDEHSETSNDQEGLSTEFVNREHGDESKQQVYGSQKYLLSQYVFFTKSKCLLKNIGAVVEYRIDTCELLQNG